MSQPCGCRIAYAGTPHEQDVDRIVFCPLHQQAEALRAALEDLLYHVQPYRAQLPQDKPLECAVREGLRVLAQIKEPKP